MIFIIKHIREWTWKHSSISLVECVSSALNQTLKAHGVTTLKIQSPILWHVQDFWVQSIQHEDAFLFECLRTERVQFVDFLKYCSYCSYFCGELCVDRVAKYHEHACRCCVYSLFLIAHFERFKKFSLSYFITLCMAETSLFPSVNYHFKVLSFQFI